VKYSFKNIHFPNETRYSIYINRNDGNRETHRRSRKDKIMTFAKSLGLRFGLSSGKAHGMADLLALAKQRRALTRLDDAALRDMGLTRAEAAHEASRPAWDVPSHWRC
jgi:uncharacterized protein YjiS (DUF1127 family)